MSDVDNIEVPDDFPERVKKYMGKYENVFPHPDHPGWYKKELNEDAIKQVAWSAPYDARFPQTRKQAQCFHYYVDFFRCKELMGEDYKPCKFFQNVYKDICPSFWIEKWDDWRDEGRFPARFDR